MWATTTTTSSLGSHLHQLQTKETKVMHLGLMRFCGGMLGSGGKGGGVGGRLMYLLTFARGFANSLLGFCHFAPFL
jgi:hypothetical protein